MDMESRAVKRRKIGGGGESSEFSPDLIQVEIRREISSVSPENSPSPASSYDKSDQVEGSCISGQECCELTDKIVKFSDLDEEREDNETLSKCNSETGESGETTPLREYEAELGELESTASPPEEEAHSLKKSTPDEAELEEFFAVAEKKIQKEFAEKYNYDIVEDKPLKGRYEWVQL